MSSESTPLPPGRLPVMVVSHERSGTHFTMNALAACFDYLSKPWVDLDHPQFNINYFSSDLQDLLLKVAELRLSNIVKNHHEFEFFKHFVAKTVGALNIVYVYRHPADVMASFWRFLHTWHWVEGPREDSVLAFAAAAPMGHSMRYQFRQYPTMLDRWANHVEHWVVAAQQESNIHLVRYEDLAENFNGTIQHLGHRLNMQPSRIMPPPRDMNVVSGGSLKYTPDAHADNRAAVAELALVRFPALMDRLGYAPSPVSAAAV